MFNGHPPLKTSLGDAHQRRPQHTSNVSRRAVLLFAGLLVLISGCEEARIPVFPVSGKVSYQGKPPVGAQVVLYPVSVTEAHDVAPSGSVKDDGTFSIAVYDTDDGAPAGEYIATIQWFKPVVDKDGSGAGPNVLPKTYANPKTSPVKVSVGNGPTEIPPINIK